MEICPFLLHKSKPASIIIQNIYLKQYVNLDALIYFCKKVSHATR
jgi:hypothetical protein